MSGSFYRPIKETASPCVAASPLQSPLPAGTTPAAKAAAHAHESRPAIGAPSAAGGRLDRTEILCCAGESLAPRVVCASAVETADPAKASAIAKGKRDFAHH